MLDMTPKDMVEAFSINSVKTCSIYDLLIDMTFKNMVCDLCVFFFYRVLIFLIGMHNK